MDGRRGKVVCHLRIGGDLKKKMKQELIVVVVYSNRGNNIITRNLIVMLLITKIVDKRVFQQCLPSHPMKTLQSP